MDYAELAREENFKDFKDRVVEQLRSKIKEHDCYQEYEKLMNEYEQDIKYMRGE